MNKHANYDPRDPVSQPLVLTEAQQQLLLTKLRLRAELKKDLRNEHDGLFVVIEDPVRHRFFSIGRREYQLLSMLDGHHSVAQIVEQHGSTLAIDDVTAITICQWAMQSNLVVDDQLDGTTRLEKQSQRLHRQKWLSALNPISIKIPLLNPNAHLTRLTPWFSWLFSPTFLLVWLGFGVWALTSGWQEWERLTNASVGILSGYRWVWLIAVWAILKVIHETAHGIACRRYGGEVNEAGMLLLLFTPMAYVNVTSSWRFANRWHRIVVAAAGMYVELFIAFLAVIAWSHSSDGLIADLCYNLFFMSGITTILFNANPLMRFDGYYILSDSLGISNLYTKGTSLFTDRLRSWFFGIPRSANPCRPAERWIVNLYGTMAFFWKILISLSLIIGASVLFYGAGKILAVVGMVFFFAIPIWRTCQQLYGPQAIHRPDSRRVALNTLLVGSVLVVLFTVAQAPATRSAPAIVRFKDETPVRAECDGIVDEILVADGQRVEAGQLLIVLTNPQLQLEIEQLQNDAAAARIQARVYQQHGDLALFQAEKEKQLGILQQLGEKQALADALRIEAPFAGFVFARQLDMKSGTFVQQGDTLLTIAEKHTKEVVVAIPQRDWDSLKGKQGTTMRVAMTSLPVFQAHISHIDPRASDIPQQDTLCADVGGPLAIRTINRQAGQTDDDHEVRLLTPHFNVDLTLSRPISKRLKSGQRGRAFFDASRQSLGAYWFLAVEEWLRKKVEIATRTAAF